MVEIIVCITIFIKIYFIYFLRVSKNIKLSISSIIIYFYFSNLYLYWTGNGVPVSNVIFKFILISIFIFITLIPYFIFLISKFTYFLKSKIQRIVFFSTSILFSDIVSSFLIGYILQKNKWDVIFDFSYVSPGYALAYTPFANLVNTYYVFGLTFFIALFVTVTYEYKLKYSYVYLFIFASIFYFVNKDSVKYNYIPKENILILGENNPISSLPNSELRKHDYILDNHYYPTSDRKVNITSKLYDKNLNVVSEVSKYFLGPMGEYYPHKLISLLKILNIEGKMTGKVESNHVQDPVVFTTINQKFIILICADAWSYVSVKRYSDIAKEVDYIILQRDRRTFLNSAVQEANIKLYKAVVANYFNKPVIDVK